MFFQELLLSMMWKTLGVHAVHQGRAYCLIKVNQGLTQAERVGAWIQLHGAEVDPQLG